MDSRLISNRLSLSLPTSSSPPLSGGGIPALPEGMLLPMVCLVATLHHLARWLLVLASLLLPQPTDPRPTHWHSVAFPLPRRASSVGGSESNLQVTSVKSDDRSPSPCLPPSCRFVPYRETPKSLLGLRLILLSCLRDEDQHSGQNCTCKRGSSRGPH